ncbi:acyltransferase [Bernardetia sp. MNP-M8]|uniref:acyltransferase family protein n=1 Tax=Bernardetia sp. MNP-M8 TaxID=3127470 RepID=UPI0030CF8718
MKNPITIKNRNIGIDILRGFSILFVILLHLNIRFGYSTTFLKEILPKKLFSLIFWNGMYGVVIFFTLSGYLITKSVIAKWGAVSQIDVKKFYFFRFARIIPLLFTLIFILSCFHIFQIDGFVINPNKASLARCVFAALTFHINWLEIQVGYLPASWDVLWSISIEEVFYLLFPIICFFIRNKWQLFFLLIFFMCLSPYARIYFYEGNELASKGYFAYFDAITFGCFMAVIADQITFQKWLLRIFCLVGLSLILFIIYYKKIVYDLGLVDLGLNITILSVGVSFLLLWLHNHHKMGKEKDYLAFRWLKSMGVYSYEIYLTHMFVVIFGVQIYKYLELSSNYLIPYSLLLILLSYFLGRIIFNYFSEPLNNWLRRKF